jgi:AraC-like DNA-binding protein
MNEKQDDLDIIKQYINTLENDVSKKTDYIETFESQVQKIVIMNFLNGDYESLARAREEFMRCNLDFNEKYFMSAVFLIDNFREVTKNLNGAGFINLRDAIEKKVLTSLRQSYMCAAYIENDRIEAVLNSGEIFDKAVLENIFRDINAGLKKNFSVTLSVCVSETETDIDSITENHPLVTGGVQERFCVGGEAFIRLSDIAVSHSVAKKDVYIFTKTESEFIAAVTHNNQDKLAVILDNVWSGLESSSLANYRATVNQIISALQKSLEQKSMFNHTEITEKAADIFRFGTKSDLHGFISELTLSAAEMYSDMDERVGYKIKNYIDQNYTADLSLVYISDVFRLSPSYLSTLFKSCTGTNVIEYLNSVRINKAKEYLETTDIPVYTVGAKVGFTNYNTFSRVFKKFSGMSAKEYRNLKLKL